jgi:O-antigen ligase
MTGNIIGFLLATYFLVGRWSMGRLDGSFDTAPIHLQPRVWIIGLLILMVPLTWARRRLALSRRKATPVDAAIILFLGYMLLSALWAPDTELAYEKAFEVFLLLVVALVFAATRSGFIDEQVEHGFWCAVVLTGVAMASVAIIKTTSGRVYVPGGGPITFGRNMGMMGIGAVYLSSRYGTGAKPLCVGIVIVSMLLILLCGSRGALLSSGVGAIALLITYRASISAKLAAGGAIALVGAVLLFNTNTGREALEVFQSRVIDQTVHNHHLAARDDLWLDALDWTAESPWYGWGLNGYRANSWTYPHNIVLEVMVEGGAIGILLLTNIGRVWWKDLRRNRYRVSRVALAGCALALTAAQTSGDLFDSRGVFLFLALASPLAAPALKASRRRLAPAPPAPVRSRPTHAGRFSPVPN